MKARASGVLRISPSRIGPSVWVEARPMFSQACVDDQLHRGELGEQPGELGRERRGRSSAANGTASLIGPASAASCRE